MWGGLVRLDTARNDVLSSDAANSCKAPVASCCFVNCGAVARARIDRPEGRGERRSVKDKPTLNQEREGL